MKNKIKFNIALITLALYIVLERFTKTHDLILGLIFGLSMGCFILGFLPESFSRKFRILKKR